MKFEGYIIKSAGKYWPVEVPCLGLHTQGKSKKDAYAMAKDAIELLADQEGFSVDIIPSEQGGLSFTIVPNDPAPMIALILKRLRQQAGLTAREVARRMGSASPNAYVQYENGRVTPSLTKFSELLKAIGPQYEPVLRIG